MENTFIIQKGYPIDPEDNRVEVEELHVHVLFKDPKLHTALWEWLDNYPGTREGVQSYQYDKKSGVCTLDIAMPRDREDCRSAIDIVANGVYLYFVRNNESLENLNIKRVYPEL